MYLQTQFDSLKHIQCLKGQIHISRKQHSNFRAAFVNEIIRVYKCHTLPSVEHSSCLPRNFLTPLKKSTSLVCVCFSHTSKQFCSSQWLRSVIYSMLHCPSTPTEHRTPRVKGLVPQQDPPLKWSRALVWPLAVLPLCLLSVEKPKLKNKLNQRSENTQKQRKAGKQDTTAV